MYLQGHLLAMDKDVYAPPNFVGFSAKTSANVTQYLIDAKLDKRRKGFFGPPVGKQMVIMIDDLNMPQKETYGAQPPIELLRQFMDHQGWYARDNSFRTMQDCLFAAAMGPPGGGRAPITQRYQRHYNLLSIVDFDTEALEHIFGTILAWFYETNEFPEEITVLRDPIIAATLDVYNQSIAKLLPTPAKSHYTFNLRDVSRVIEGLTLQKAEGIKTGLGGVGEHFRLWVHETMRVFYDRLVDVMMPLDPHVHQGAHPDALCAKLQRALCASRRRRRRRGGRRGTSPLHVRRFQGRGRTRCAGRR